MVYGGRPRVHHTRTLWPISLIVWVASHTGLLLDFGLKLLLVKGRWHLLLNQCSVFLLTLKLLVLSCDICVTSSGTLLESSDQLILSISLAWHSHLHGFNLLLRV